MFIFLYLSFPFLNIVAISCRCELEDFQSVLTEPQFVSQRSRTVSLSKGRFWRALLTQCCIGNFNTSSCFMNTLPPSNETCEKFSSSFVIPWNEHNSWNWSIWALLYPLPRLRPLHHCSITRNTSGLWAFLLGGGGGDPRGLLACWPLFPNSPRHSYHWQGPKKHPLDEP